MKHSKEGSHEPKRKLRKGVCVSKRVLDINSVIRDVLSKNCKLTTDDTNTIIVEQNTVGNKILGKLDYLKANGYKVIFLNSLDFKAIRGQERTFTRESKQIQDNEPKLAEGKHKLVKAKDIKVVKHTLIKKNNG